MTEQSNELTAANITLDNGIPTSNTFTDIYFSAEDGVAESYYNFIIGNQLPDRFAEPTNKSFTIIETGFGTGLNTLLTAQLWQQTAPASRCLHYLSTEKYPIPAKTLAAIYKINKWNGDFIPLPAHPLLEPLDEISNTTVANQQNNDCRLCQSSLAQQLLAAYPPLQSGQYTIPLAANIYLTLLWGDSVTQLQHHDCTADAFFLDGFAPRKNPEMWSDTLFSILRQRSVAGTTFATFTAAGHVRRGLQAAGFSVQKQKGFGRKRERLVGYL